MTAPQRRMAWSAADHRRWRELYGRPMSIQKIRDIYRQEIGEAPAYAVVWRSLKLAGVLRSRSAGQVVHRGLRTRARMCRLDAMLAAGQSKRAAARELGVSYEAIQDWAALLRRQEGRAA